MRELRIIGLMSGTSLDGLDLVACTFYRNEQWDFDVNFCKTIPYDPLLRERLSTLDSSSALEYARLDHHLGRHFGKEISKFIQETGFKPHYISSHGHTIFHQPHDSFSTQIGHLSAISALTKLPAIGDFRTVDVHLNGQGAPLVPIGDQLLFPGFHYCLNLGGIANISIKSNGPIVAFDVCIANMALNYVSKTVGKDYDDNGDMARSGTLISDCLGELNSLQFHDRKPPKSIGKEWFDLEVKPILDKNLAHNSAADVLFTLCEHTAMQIGVHVPTTGKLLITGGGAFNTHLISKISEYCNAIIHLPEKDIINFKEAIIFAFLGALYISNDTNVLSSVTGAESDHIGGCLYKPFGQD